MVALFILDRQLRCGFINEVAELVAGLSRAEATGRPFAELMWARTPGGFERSEISRLLRERLSGAGEEGIVDPAGVMRPFSFRVTPLDVAGDGLAGSSVVELTDLSGVSGTSRAFRESEQRLRLAVETTAIGIWDVNVLTGERRWSSEFRSVLGLPEDASADMENFASVIHPDDRDRIVELYRRAYETEGGDIYHAEFRIRRANDGVERWVAVTGRVTFDGNGRPIRGIGTLRDIDQRRRNEEALRENEERLRIALVAGRMGTWRYDIATGEQQWDDTQYRLFGLSPSVKPTRDLFLSLVHPDDFSKVSFDVPYAFGAFIDSEFRVRRPDTGEWRWMSAHAIARQGPDGKALEVIGVNRDVTEQREAEVELRVSEERNRLAIEANGLGTWDLDMVTRQHRWSDQFKALWGLPPGSPSDPALLRASMEPHDWYRVSRHWAKARRSGGRIAVDYPIRRADDGVQRWLALTGRIFFDEMSGVAVRAAGIMFDITDRREREERQRVIMKELNHRVKNTLAVVQAIVSQTLKMSKPSEAFPRIQARLMAVARTHDFLNLVNWVGVSLTELLRAELEPYAIVDDNRVVVSGEPIALDSRSALALGLTFHELATNAAKYGSLSQAEGRLAVRWRVEAAAEGRVLEIIWAESGGPPVRTPRRLGFGSRLIEGSVGGNLGGSVKLDYARTGLVCTMRFPLPVVEGLAAGGIDEESGATGLPR